MSYKVLGQQAPTAASETTLYTVPASKETVVSTLTATNRSAVATEIRIAVRVAGGAVQDEDYLVYDLTIPGNEMLSLTMGVTLATTDLISVYNTLATISFQAFGSESDV